jgi:hypothetical protein
MDENRQQQSLAILDSFYYASVNSCILFLLMMQFEAPLSDLMWDDKHFRPHS